MPISVELKENKYRLNKFGLAPEHREYDPCVSFDVKRGMIGSGVLVMSKLERKQYLFIETVAHWRPSMCETSIL